MRSIVKTFVRELPPIKFPMRSDGKVDVCPVDAFAGATFNVNEFGHIKSDVSALMQAQSQNEIDMISRRLVEAQGENPDLSGLTDSDIFKYSMSRYYQSPREVELFGERLAKAQYDRNERLSKEAAEKAAHDEMIAKQKAAFDAFQQAVKDGKIDSNGNLINS